VKKDRLFYILFTSPGNLTVIILLVMICNQACEKHSAVYGYFRMNRVEVFENNRLAKVIDTGLQFWNFSSLSTIQIYNTAGLQNTLYINKFRGRIQSRDKITGKLREEFFIRKWDQQTLELCSTKSINKNQYNIIYFLEKINDSSVNKEFPLLLK
jgi:hypothetical protein